MQHFKLNSVCKYKAAFLESGLFENSYIHLAYTILLKC